METNDLPVWSIMPDVLDALRRGRNVVLAAPPGSGKTTQVPQALLDNNLVKGTILVVQPRRVACRAVGQRVANEREVEIGNEVGYIVRYDGRNSADTKLLFVTDGVLLRFLERDSALSGVGAVIFDEFHERRAMTDVALGLLKVAQMRRPSLRLIVMSATMDCARVAEYLNAECLSTEGRAYPVDVRYVPCSSHDETIQAVAKQVMDLHVAARLGDILVFLAGKEEIRRAEKALIALKPSGLVVLPLHGELTRQAQDRVFRPSTGRKVILATNVAETSITIPGVRTVIDTGYEKRADFDPAVGVNRLAVMPISKVSADQRAGRAGREDRGLCVRLWSQRTHEEREDRQPAEMQRTDLASIVLTLKSLGITDPATFDLLDQPDHDRLSAAEDYLIQLGAVGQDRLLTTIGWRMLRLPLPPRYARMVVESERSGCLKEVASIAALMAGRPILASKLENGAEHAKIRFASDDSSDFFSLLSMFRVSQEHRWSSEWCEKHGVHADALHEAIRLRRKVIHVAFSRGTPQTKRVGNPAAIRRCILSGLVDRVALCEKNRVYRLSNGVECSADRNTVVRGKLLAAADIRFVPARRGQIEPTALLAYVTRIDTDMLRQIAPHLFRHVRLPMELRKGDAFMTIREELRFQELVIESHMAQVDIPEALVVIAEQRQRAAAYCWHRVEVLPSVGSNTHAIWNGERLPVQAESAGPHWASIYGARSPKVILRERIVILPGTEVETERPFPPGFENRVQRTSAAVAKLLGRGV
jgi:ATP-dependent helicase HrpB